MTSDAGSVVQALREAFVGTYPREAAMLLETA